MSDVGDIRKNAKSMDRDAFAIHYGVPDYIRDMDLLELKARSDIRTSILTANWWYLMRTFLTISSTDKRLSALLAARARRRDIRESMKDMLVTEASKGEMSLDDECCDDSQVNVTMIEPTPRHVDTAGAVKETLKSDGELAQLREFFARPVVIYDSSFGTGDFLSTTATIQEVLRVWDVWVDSPAVRSKLANYAFMKGDLHLKINVTGAPYVAGAIQFSYQPFDLTNETLKSYTDLLVSTLPILERIRDPYLTYLSSGPSVAYADIKANEPIEMCVPFLLPKEKARIYPDGAGVIDNNTVFEDLNQMGALYITSLGHNQTSTSVASNITINIQAFVTNIELSSKTGTNFDVVAEALHRPITQGSESRKCYEHHVRGSMPMCNWTEADKENLSTRIDRVHAQGKDEYGEPGVVSKVASGVANIGNALSSVPIIGGIARATGTVAGVVSKVAHIFGFSQPAIITPPIRNQELIFSNGAFTSGNNTTHKMTLDPKQELALAVDLGGTGGDDPMTIKSMAMRESLVGTSSTIPNDVPMETIVLSMFVSPSIYVKSSLKTDQDELFQPANVAFASTPFRYWRGTMRYRVLFSTSKFTRGKFIITYERNINQKALLLGQDLTLNQQGHIIVDIAESNEVVFDVHWNSDRSWALVGPEDETTFITESCAPSRIWEHDPVGNVSSFVDAMCNGYFEIRPYSVLDMQEMNKVEIYVWASCPDLEVAVPHIQGIEGTSSRLYNETEADKTSFEAELAPISLNENMAADGTQCLRHFGESVVSFRSLLKRYHHTWTGNVNTDSERNLHRYKVQSNIYPSLTEYNAVTASKQDASAIVGLFNYLRFAYMAMRGGYRYRIMNICDSNAVATEYATVSLLLNHDFHYDTTYTEVPITTAASLNSSFKNDLEGAVQFDMSTNGGVDFEVPFYSRDLYELAFSATRGRTLTSSLFSADEIGWQYDLYSSPRSTSGVDSNYNAVILSASAEDFTFLRFNGGPFFTILS